MAIATINPFNNKEVKKFDVLSESTIDEKVSSADKAYNVWRDKPVEERAKLLAKVAQLLQEKKKELAKLITLEMGKLIGESEDEIDISSAIFKYYSDNAEKFLEDKPFEVKEGKAYVRYSPIGVILGVEPWNYPFYQVARIAAPNIAVGNVIMIKHASNVPQCAQAIEDIFKEAGAEEGIYTNLFVAGDKIGKLAEDERIKGLSLTGSEKAGASLAEAAGKNLKKSVLELGGSDPFIVLDDADLDNAVAQAFDGRMKNMGQSCTAAKRMIVLESVADEFLEKLTKKMSGLKVGNPADESTEIGPLSSEDAAKQLAEQVEDTVRAGAKAVIGGKRLDREGAFMEPTILTDIKPGMRAYREELFGPVASFYRVKDENEAIKLANDSTFGLGGAVFSKDIARAEKVALQIETGMVFINEPTNSSPELPFGGTKRSGYGRELSSLGIEEFVNKKLIRISGK
ncbi:NAD-dependent succinate-semialdehyde dehydrogenase [Flavobacterium sp. DG1-102-2]|uniref:NAD-dependent succinate-semialdehyde dehydrogenase n=1 Tax=Flavobacterium sp. DG1-102-2 TaxID=3081663 RepID=UPI0029492950|nr:NAD-dependent succinate-semialdehyde dehydrogenase [Flavobacterium sp. DG1-102-2]MDV6167094.1 NAD-dependent succinate-semialdehyde dehydrogenase [Flavobacterium sp. DG1-102-2]